MTCRPYPARKVSYDLVTILLRVNTISVTWSLSIIVTPICSGRDPENEKYRLLWVSDQIRVDALEAIPAATPVLQHQCVNLLRYKVINVRGALETYCCKKEESSPVVRRPFPAGVGLYNLLSPSIHLVARL